MAMASLIVVMVSTLFHTYFNTIESSAQSSFGCYDSQVAVQNSQVISVLTREQKNHRAVAVTHDQATLISASHQRALQLNVVYVSANARKERIIQGRYPHQSGEVTVSAHAANILHVRPRDKISLRTSDGEKYKVIVSGISINAAHASENLAVVNLPRYFDGHQANVWLINDNLKSVEPYGSDGSMSWASSTGYLRQVVDAASGSSLKTLKFVQYSAFMLVFMLIVAFIFADRRRLQERRDLLIHLGDTVGIAAHTVALSDTVLTLIASACGAGIGCSVMAVWFRQIGELFDHVWDSIDVSYMVSFGLGTSIALTIVVYISESAVAYVRKLKCKSSSGISHVAAWIIWGTIGTLVTLVLVALRQILILRNGHYAAMLVGSVSVSACVLGVIALSLHQYKTLQGLSRKTIWVRYFSLVLTFIVCFYASMYMSFTSYSINGIRGLAPDSDGYISAKDISEDTIKQLDKKFPDVMHSADVFYKPDESLGQVRVISDSDKEVECVNNAMREHTRFDMCDFNILTSVVIAKNGTAAETLADSAPPETVKDGTSHVIVLVNNAGVYTVGNHMLAHGIRPSKTLKYDFLRSMVVAENGPAYKELGLHTSSVADVYIPHIYNYPSEEINALRSLILIQAPYTLLQESDSAEFRDMQTNASARILAAIMVTLIAYVVSLTAWRSEQRQVRLFARAQGVGPWSRFLMIMPLVVPFMCVIICAVVLGHLASLDYIPIIMSRGISVSRGTAWSITGVGIIAPLLSIVRELHCLVVE
ncbi:hypothetical protein ACFQY8_00215 [Alloscardovia venturai]|uniref:ABC transporter permease n=1 Tax=Alloscardovia venturai TaxID=1769421 RepID=A0ABW2Y1P8_9BIFI